MKCQLFEENTAHNHSDYIRKTSPTTHSVVSFAKQEEDDGDEDQFSDFGDGDGCERGDAESQGVQQHGTGNSGEATTTAEKAGDSSTFASEGAAESEQARDLASSRNDGLVTKEKKEVTETLETEAEAPGREHASSGRAEDEAETFTPQDGSSNACVGDAGRNTRTAASSTDQEDGIPNQDATSPTQAEDGSNITPTLQRDSAGDVAVERTSGGVEARAGKGGSDGVNVDHDHDHDHDSGIETRTANEANEQEGSDSSQPQPQPQPQLQQDAGESIRDGAAVGQPEPSDRELSNGDSDDRSDSNDRVDSDDRGDSDDRVDSGGGQREEHEESSVESGYKSEGFEGDGDSSVRCSATLLLVIPLLVVEPKRKYLNINI